MKSFFSKPKKSDLIIEREFSNEKTFNDICKKYIPKSLEQTFLLAETLVGRSAEVSAKMIYQFCRDNINYSTDDEGLEQIRLPNQTWKDRKRGVDCEDFVIFCSSILNNQLYSHTIRMADYGNGWQHIYIVLGIKKQIVLDPTLSVFNKEFKAKRFKEYTFKH